MKDFFSISKQQFWIATIVSVCVIIVAVCYGWMTSNGNGSGDESENPATGMALGRDLRVDEDQATLAEDDLQKTETEETVSKPIEDQGQPKQDVVTSSANFLMPVKGEILRNYSMSELSYYPTLNQYMVHTGMDIVAPDGTEVCAAADGLVSKVFEDKMMGRTVWLSHEGEVTTVYSNLGEGINVEEGDVVVKGQAIAKSGNSSLIEKSDEPHVHIEVLLKGKTVDPRDYFGGNKSED